MNIFAEAIGFEPMDPFGSPVFQVITNPDYVFTMHSCLGGRYIVCTHLEFLHLARR